MSASHLVVGAVLEQDHRRIDDQLEAFARSLVEGTPDGATFTAASAALRHHIYVEEEYHFPEVRAAGLLGPVLVMLREHGQIWDLLDAIGARLREGAPAEDLAEAWHRLEQVLTGHNLKEECILYPAGDQNLSDEVAQQVLAALSSEAAPAGWVCEMAGKA